MSSNERYSTAFQVQALEMLGRGIPGSIVAREMGVDPGVIERLERLVEDLMPGDAAYGKLSGAEMKKELEYLRRNVADLKRENAILKAANNLIDRHI